MTKEQISEELTSIRDYMEAKGAVVGNGQITALIEKLNGATEPLKSVPAVVIRRITETELSIMIKYASDYADSIVNDNEGAVDGNEVYLQTLTNILNDYYAKGV